MALTGDTFDLVQGGVVTSSAQLVDGGATAGDVLTVQADKSIAAEPGGGSLTVSDGSTIVDPTTYITLTGATVADGGGGTADVTIEGGSTPDLAAVLGEGSNGGGVGMSNTGQIDTGGDDVNTNGGAIDTDGGNIGTNGGTVNVKAGHLKTGSTGSVQTALVEAESAAGLTVGAAFSTLGFFGASTVNRPEVPAIPTPQDIVDALLALGLVQQAS